MRAFPYLFSAFLLLVFAFPVEAQHHVGVIAGLNFADLGTKTAEGGVVETVPRTKFAIGGVFELWLRENVYLHIEPKYLQKGGKLIQEDPIPDLDFKFSFVEVPLFVKLAFGENIRRYAFFGPSFGFLLTAEVESKYEPLIYTADVKDITEKVDFCLGMGTGISFPLGGGSIFIDGRYSAGMTDLNKGGTVEFKSGDAVIVEEISRSDRISTKGFQIVLGYTFPIGGRKLVTE